MRPAPVRVQAVDPAVVFGAGAARDGQVLVHADFGPNNVVLGSLDHGQPSSSVERADVRLLCDWEWVRVGDPFTDLAWAELIVRLHHPEAVCALGALFDGYGRRPPFEQRREAMTARAAEHREFVSRWHGPVGARTWAERLATIATWQEA